MAGQVSRIRSATHAVAMPFSSYSPQAGVRGGLGLDSSRVTAYNVEFVAKPGEALKAQSALAPAISGTLKGVTGFAGCIVMTSDQEARLMTVVTFWRGTDRMKHCNANMRWVNALLTPYMDRRLRVQTMVAQLPEISLSECEAENLNGEEMEPDFAEQENEICVA